MNKVKDILLQTYDTTNFLIKSKMNEIFDLIKLYFL